MGCKFTCWIRGVRVRLRRGRLLHRVWCFIRSLVVKFYHQDFGSEPRAAPLVRARSREVRSDARFHHKNSRLLMWWRIIDGAARALRFQTEAFTSVKHTRLQKKASNELVKKNSVRHKMNVVLIYVTPIMICERMILNCCWDVLGIVGQVNTMIFGAQTAQIKQHFW